MEALQHHKHFEYFSTERHSGELECRMERALQELNHGRETWCRVETDARQAWDRSQRRHYRSHLQTSPVLISALTGGEQHRAAGTFRPPPQKLPERRHFEDSYKSHLV